MKGVGNMERKPSAVFESETAIVRIYTGPLSDTEEKLRKLIEPVARKFYKDIVRSNPNYFKQNKQDNPTGK